jgi:hypothetical protein
MGPQAHTFVRADDEAAEGYREDERLTMQAGLGRDDEITAAAIANPTKGNSHRFIPAPFDVAVAEPVAVMQISVRLRVAPVFISRADFAVSTSGWALQSQDAYARINLRAEDGAPRDATW